MHRSRGLIERGVLPDFFGKGLLSSAAAEEVMGEKRTGKDTQVEMPPPGKQGEASSPDGGADSQPGEAHAKRRFR